MSSIHFPPSSSSSGLATSQSCPLPCFSRFLYALCLCPNLHPPSLPLAIFLHLELSLFCLFSIPRPSVNPSVTPSLSYLSFSSGLSISPRFTRSCFTSPILFPFLVLFRSLNLASPLLLLGAVLLSSRCSARRKYSLFAPPLDMAKEAICALLAILGHFFEAFSPLDLFFAPSPFRPVPRPFPAFLHPGCRRFPPLPIPFLHRFQPIPSPARPLKSTSSRPGSHPSRRHPPVLSSSSELLSLSLTELPHQSPFAPSCVHPPLPAPPARAVRTRGVFTHRDDFGEPACVERGLVRTAMFHAPADVPLMGAPVMERAGSSGNAENGSYLAEADAAEGRAGQVDGPGSSGNAENGSHLAATGAADGHAWQVDGPGSSGNAENGSLLAETDAAKGHAGQVDGPGSSGNAGKGSYPAETDAAKGHAGQVDGPGSSGNAGKGSYPAATDAAKGHAGQVASSGMSGNTENGSHLAETDAAESHAGHAEGPGSSRNARIGSHLAATDAAKGHAGHAEGSGSSEFTKNGSHLAVADFSDEPWAVMWRRPPPRRTESGRLSYGTASPDSSVQKTALWCTRGSS